jgi:hypothetical protein
VTPEQTLPPLDVVLPLVPGLPVVPLVVPLEPPPPPPIPPSKPFAPPEEVPPEVPVAVLLHAASATNPSARTDASTEAVGDVRMLVSRNTFGSIPTPVPRSGGVILET